MDGKNPISAASRAAGGSSSATIQGGSGFGIVSNSQLISGWGTANNKTLAHHVKETSWQTPAQHLQHNNQQHNNTTSMPWAAAVRSPPDHTCSVAMAAAMAANNSFDYNNTIGSWTSPESSSSNRGGWNADGSSKSDGALDDGTAIWGNPTSKKTGVDWTEKESLINPAQAQVNSNSEKRIQKPVSIINSINGTEAWGAPVRSPLNSQPQQSKNDNSGNTYGGSNSKTTYESSTSSLNWGESSSLQQQQQAAATNENSSPPNASVWNNLGVNNNKQKSLDWLSSSGCSISGRSNSTANARLDELNKQLESASLFDSVSNLSASSSSMTKSVAASNNLEQHSINVGIGNSSGKGNGGGNCMNDLKQMSANYTNDLLDPPDRQIGGLSTSNNQQSQQLESAAYSSAAATPSRDLLKQMVHQIQLAVQAGHLNAHILNQPMSTPTLQLVYQLLQQIKTLHQLQEIQQRAGIKSDISSPSNMDLQINRIRQNISLLQKAITQQQAALTKNETIGESSIKQQANNHSYATISKLSTNLKVPSNNMLNIINNSNIDSFRRGSLIDTLSNSNSDLLRSAQASFDANATIDKTLSSFIQASSANNILGSSNKAITTSGDFSNAQGFSSANVNQQPNKGLLPAQTSSSSSSSAWSAFSSLYDWGDLSSSSLQFNADENHMSKPQATSSGAGNGGGGARPAPPPGLLSNFGPIIGGPASTNGISLLDSWKLNSSNDENQQLQSRESSTRDLWSGTWFD